MRRQIKPFVKEYRASGRKPKEIEPARREVVRREPDRQSFARWPAEPDPAADASSTSSFKAALRAADALFTRRDDAESAAPRATDRTGDHAERSAGHADSPRPRILPSLEQSRLQRVAAEPEVEPKKRRGRKPGSKNKPKIGAATAVVKDDVGTSAAGRAHETPLAKRAPAAAAKPSTHRPIVQSSRAARPRFGWVRATLKPGQRWKRRLPKILW